MPLDTVNRVMPSASSTSITGSSDASKNLQNQIMSKEQNLSKISNDASLDAKEKAKKRQELQREIEKLNRKLELIRIRQEENEKAAKAKATKADMIKEQSSVNSDDNERADIYAEDKVSKPVPDKADIDAIKNVLSSNLILQDELIQQNISTDKENTTRIMQSEIRQDVLYGNDTAKQKEDMYNTITKDDFLIEAVDNNSATVAQTGNQRIKISITD